MTNSSFYVEFKNSKNYDLLFRLIYVKNWYTLKNSALFGQKIVLIVAFL